MSSMAPGLGRFLFVPLFATIREVVMGLLCNKVKALDFFLFFSLLFEYLVGVFFLGFEAWEQYEFSFTTSGVEEKKILPLFAISRR